MHSPCYEACEAADSDIWQMHVRHFLMLTAVFMLIFFPRDHVARSSPPLPLSPPAPAPFLLSPCIAGVGTLRSKTTRSEYQQNTATMGARGRGRGRRDRGRGGGDI
eukprot:750246-Hanusia_phi.AAC.2